MNFLSGLFAGKGMQEAALGTLRKSMESQGLNTCVIRLIPDPDNPGIRKFDFEFRQEDNLVLITQADLDTFQAAYAKTVAL
jgi:hypothetical protein